MNTAHNEHSSRWMRTHHAIERAFVEMLSNHSPDDITVSSLTQHARIHRKTFYLHFTSIDDVYEDYVQTLAHQYSEIIRDLPLPYDYYTLSRIMFDFYTQSEQVEKIFTHPRYRALADQFIIHTTKSNRLRYNPYKNFTEDEQELINTFVVYSSVNVFRRWALSGKKVPRERAIQILGDLLEQGVAPVRAPYTPSKDTNEQ